MADISVVGRKHFETIYELVRPHFPRNCTKCGREFKNELDYNLKTVAVEGHTDVRNIGLGFFFHRNHIYTSNERRRLDALDLRELRAEDCPEDEVLPGELCRTTQTVVLNGERKHPEWTDFLNYVHNRAKREGLNNQAMMDIVRREYNSYLIKRELKDLIYVSD